MNSEEEIMIKEGVEKGQYELEIIIKEMETHSNKELYVMKYNIKRGSPIAASFNRKMFTKSALYIYFPENFEKTHVSFVFLINENYIPAPFYYPGYEPDTSQIMPVINNFELKVENK